MRVFLTVLGVILFALSAAAWAQDLVVVNSTAPSLKPGQMVKSDAPIDVPAGTSVTLVSESGKILTLNGPHSGPPGMGGGGGGATPACCPRCRACSRPRARKRPRSAPCAPSFLRCPPTIHG